MGSNYLKVFNILLSLLVYTNVYASLTQGTLPDNDEIDFGYTKKPGTHDDITGNRIETGIVVNTRVGTYNYDDENMAKDYITYNEKLNEKLDFLGFKRKNKNTFIRKHDEAIQSLCWAHHTYYDEPHVKYYSITAYIDFPVVCKKIKDIGVFVEGIGKGLGYFLPVPVYKEWRLADDAKETEVEAVINEIVTITDLYVIPYLDKYSRLNDIIRGIEDNELNFYSDFKFLLPVLYLTNGQHDKACLYINNILDKMQKIHEAKNNENKKLQELFENDNIEMNTSRTFESYKIYAEKFRKHLTSFNSDIKTPIDI